MGTYNDLFLSALKISPVIGGFFIGLGVGLYLWKEERKERRELQAEHKQVATQLSSALRSLETAVRDLSMLFQSSGSTHRRRTQT